MNKRSLTVGATLAVLGLCVTSAIAQTRSDPSRLFDGKPDLQGVWDFRTITPRRWCTNRNGHATVPTTPTLIDRWRKTVGGPWRSSHSACCTRVPLRSFAHQVSWLEDHRR